LSTQISKQTTAGGDDGRARAELDDAVVDVAIPVYRRTTFLAEAIESVLAQDFRRWRLRICDNGAGGGEIARVAQAYLGDPRVSYDPTGVELNLPQNWTRAISLGTAPFVALLHDDDRWHPTFLGARVDALQAHPECAYAFGEVVQIEVDGTELFRMTPRFRQGVLSRAVLADALVQGCAVSTPSVVVRRAAYDEVGPAFTEQWQYCDWEMWARMATRFPAYFLAANDSDLRRHASTYSLAVHQPPDELISMVEDFEARFRTSIDGFELAPLTRARYHSRILLSSAEAIHQGGGWKLSHELYLSAIRTYPPTALRRGSLRMIGRSVLGSRGAELVAGALRRARPTRES
jgi:glycosyltransferase involved in cell wall biosynthesis